MENLWFIDQVNLLFNCSCTVWRKMVDRQQKWFLIVLTTGTGSSIRTNEESYSSLLPLSTVPATGFPILLVFGITCVLVYLRFFFHKHLVDSSILAFHLELIYISCRAPNPDTVLVIQTPRGVISTKSLLRNKKKAGSRLISCNRTKLEETPFIDNTEQEPFSAARCRVFQRVNYTKKVVRRRFVYMLMKVNNIII